MEADQIRFILPEEEREHFDDIVLQRVLGASKHIAMIGRMLCAVAKTHAAKEGDTAAMLADLKAVADYFKATRGQASSAIGNAIDYMARGFSALAGLPVREAAEAVEDAVARYGADAAVCIERLTGYAAALARGMKRVMVFDYSSTVNAFLMKMGEVNPGSTVLIPESRVINGGYAFVPTALKSGLRVHFIPDSAMMYYLRECDGAFFGAETFYPDGTAFNTTGSDIVGLVCHTYGIPLYILTPLIKLDTRPLSGYVRTLVNNNTREKLRSAGFTPGELEQVDFDCPELLPVEPGHIRAFVTEKGVIPPGAMFEVSARYAEILSGRND